MDALPNAEDLSLRCVDASTQRVSWTDLEFSEWRYWEATRAEDRVWVYPGDEAEYRQELGYPLHERCAGPMMNFAYELEALAPYRQRRGPAEAAALLAGLPLCLVETSALAGDGYFLALTGGGMDLTWEIVEAYVRLGFAPPTEHASLPRMAGRGDSERDEAIIGAARKSLQSGRQKHERMLEELERNFAQVT